MAPFMPMLGEALHRNLVRRMAPDAPLSVHMEPWPQSRPERLDRALLAQTAVVQRVVTLGRAARASSGHRVRQPLSRLLVRVPDDAAVQAVRGHAEQILDELNVKALEFIARDAELVSYRIKPNLPRLGKRYGKLIPAIRQACAEADGARIAASVAQREPFTLVAGGETLHLEPEDVLIETSSAEGYTSAEEEGFLVALDTHLDDALLREGLARELVRTVQDARKQADLRIADRIRLRIAGSPGVEAALAHYRDFIMSETLAVAWGDGGFHPEFSVEHTLAEEHWTIALARQG
jgi:isoleucyl-tRNA synthetase